MNSHLKNIMLWVVLFIVAILLWSLFRGPAQGIETLNYTRFLEELDAGRVSEVTLKSSDSGTEIEGQYKEKDARGEQKTFTTYAPPDDGLVEKLRDRNVQLTAEQLRGTLQRMRVAENSIFLLAEAGGDVIGTLSVEGGRYRKVRHNAVLGISVHRNWRRQGVAGALMQAAYSAAQASGVLKRLTLSVFETNASAVQLYESLGYTVEGRRRGGVRIGDRYVDELIMALEVEAR